jgi:hypothetical protein
MELVDPDVTFEMNLKNLESIFDGMSEEFLKLRIKDTFLPQIYKYCNKS